MQASSKFAAIQREREARWIKAGSGDRDTIVTHYRVSKEAAPETGVLGSLFGLRIGERRLDAQMQDICAEVDCTGVSDIYQYQDFYDSAVVFDEGYGVTFDLMQEVVGTDYGGAYDDFHGGWVEIGLEIYDDNGYAEANLIGYSPPHFHDVPNTLGTSSDVPGEGVATKVPCSVGLRPGQQNPSLTGTQSSRVATPTRTWNLIDCADTPAIYWSIFEQSFWGSIGGFVGGGAGVSKGCVTSAIGGPKAYLACVGAGASFGAIVAGSVMFGIKLAEMQIACAKELFPENSLTSQLSESIELSAIRRHLSGVEVVIPIPSREVGLQRTTWSSESLRVPR